MNYMEPQIFLKLTKKDAFSWHAKEEEVFQNLKRILTSVPVLRLPYFTQKFTVECDALLAFRVYTSNFRLLIVTS